MALFYFFSSLALCIGGRRIAMSAKQIHILLMHFMLAPAIYPCPDFLLLTHLLMLEEDKHALSHTTTTL